MALPASIAGAGLVAAAIGAWWWQQGAPTPAPAPPTDMTSHPAPSAQTAAPKIDAPVLKPELPPAAPPVVQAVPPAPSPIGVEVAGFNEPYQIGSGPLRIQVKADEPGFLYLFGRRAGDDGLQLLLPSGAGRSIELAAGQQRELEIAAKSLAARPPGDWTLWIVVSRTAHELSAAEWRKDQKRFAALDPRKSNDRNEDWLAPLCGSSTKPCDQAFGLRTRALTTLAAPRPVAKAPAAPAPAPPAKDPVRAAAQADPPKSAQPAECARLMQRLSLGDGGADLAKRMAALGCR